MVDASLRATILESLRALNRDFGISILYVTHDLTTAYQICTNIIIMYRGSVVEAGTVEEVIREPKHPYTQLLIDSIPRMTAVRNWERDEEESVSDADSITRQSSGCKFADRCPAVMEKCWTHIPDFYRTRDHQIASCFLYEDQPSFEAVDIAETFAQAQPKTPLPEK